MEFGITRKSVLKARLSPGSQVGQITAITAVILSYNGSLWKLRDFQMLPEIINIPCLPFTNSKPWKWPQDPHGTQDKHPQSSGSDLPWHASAAWNPHEHELSQHHSLLCAFSSAQAQPDSVPHVGQRVQGCCSDLCSLQAVAWERIWCSVGKCAVPGRYVQGSGNRNKSGWSTWHSIFCPDWHNDSCTTALPERMRTDMAVYCPCFASWLLGGKLLGRDQH